MAVIDFTPLSEKSTPILEWQQGTSLFGPVENPSNVFLGLADLLGDQLAHIYPVNTLSAPQLDAKITELYRE